MTDAKLIAPAEMRLAKIPLRNAVVNAIRPSSDVSSLAGPPDGWRYFSISR
jgi:hypothetical protein